MSGAPGHGWPGSPLRTRWSASTSALDRLARSDGGEPSSERSARGSQASVSRASLEPFVGSRSVEVTASPPILSHPVGWPSPGLAAPVAPPPRTSLPACPFPPRPPHTPLALFKLALPPLSASSSKPLLSVGSAKSLPGLPFSHRVRRVPGTSLARSLLLRALVWLTALALLVRVFLPGAWEALPSLSGGGLLAGPGLQGAGDLAELIALAGDDPGAALRWGKASGSWEGAGEGGSNAEEGESVKGSTSSESSAPRLIPRIIHQTYKSTQLPAETAGMVASWKRKHPGWEYRFYDDAACLAFVRARFPEYEAAYRALSRDVERSDFFRYMVVLAEGGVYADIDTEARVSLDEVLQAADTLVVGWEADFETPLQAVEAWYVRPRQVLQWVFAGAAGHPALRAACEGIRRSADRGLRFSLSPSIDTLERTGPGAFTDAVLGHARAHPWAGGAADPWTVRVLPRSAFGLPKTPSHGLSPADPGALVTHHFLGSWRARRRWPWQLGWAEFRAAVEQRLWARPGDAEALQVEVLETLERADDVVVDRWSGGAGDPVHGTPASSSASAPSAVSLRLRAAPPAALALPLPRLYPVSLGGARTAHQLQLSGRARAPAFVALAPRAGKGEELGGSDVCRALAAHGAWQPGVAPQRGPSLSDVLAGAMGRVAAVDGGVERSRTAESSSVAPRPVLWDLGAGYGLASLAAAARGHHVVAVEAAPGPARALEASVRHGGFEDRVRVVRAALGAQSRAPERACLAGQEDWDEAMRRVLGRGSAREEGGSRRSLGEAQLRVEDVLGAAAPAQAARAEDEAQMEALAAARGFSRAWEATEARRGYGKAVESSPIESSFFSGSSPASVSSPSSSSSCRFSVPRIHPSALVQPGERPAVISLSVGGWEARVLRSMRFLLESETPPPVLSLEWSPHLLKLAGEREPLELLRWLHALGYTEASHSGYVCDERWFALTHGIRRRGGALPEQVEAFKQPTWCTLPPEAWELLLQRAPASAAETLLFVHRRAGRDLYRVTGDDKSVETMARDGDRETGVTQPLAA